MKDFKFKIDGVDYEVSVNELEGNNAEVIVNGKSFNVELKSEQPTTAAPSAHVTQAAATPATGKKVASNINAPLPGSIIKVLVSNGQTVKRGDILLTMESMKMENNVCAEADGTVKNVLVKQGQSVMQDDVLIEFEGTAAAAALQTKPAAPKAAPAPASAAAPQAKPAGGASSVKAPLPGSIIKVLVSEGQAVKHGDVLLTMESMKMENNIMAEKDGVVGKIYVQAGKSVMQDDVLLDLA